MDKKQNKSLSWEDFQALGDPNAEIPEIKQDENENLITDSHLAKSVIRIHLEKKGRGGKSVSIIKGLDLSDGALKDIEKSLKSHCGVGGSLKHGEIILQGDHRDKIISYLKSKGAKDIKKAGA